MQVSGTHVNKRNTEKVAKPPREHHAPGSHFSVADRLGATHWSTYTQFEGHALRAVSIKHPQVFTARWSCITLEGRRFKREEIYGYLWLIHVGVWQKRKFCKAILFQLTNKLIKTQKEGDLSWTPSFSAGRGCEARKDSVGNRLTPQGPDRSHWYIWVCG